MCQEHNEPNNLCYAKTLKALMIYKENEKQLDNHVIAVLFEKSWHSSVHRWTEIAGWPQNEKILLSLLQSYIQSGLRVIQCLFPTVLNGHSSNQQMCIWIAVSKSSELPRQSDCSPSFPCFALQWTLGPHEKRVSLCLWQPEWHIPMFWEKSRRWPVTGSECLPGGGNDAHYVYECGQCG